MKGVFGGHRLQRGERGQRARSLDVCPGADRGYFTYASGHCQLELLWQRPTPYEIGIISRAPFRLGVTVVERCVFLLYAWNGSLYGDAPYVMNTEPKGVDAPGELAPQTGLAVTIRLFDRGGRERATRNAVVGAPVSSALRAAIQEYEPPSRFDRQVRMVGDVYRRLTLTQLIGTGVWADTAWRLKRRD